MVREKLDGLKWKCEDEKTSCLPDLSTDDSKENLFWPSESRGAAGIVILSRSGSLS